MTRGSGFPALIVAIAGCLALAPSPPSTRAEEPPPPWVADFDAVWQHVHDQFYDEEFRGLDWDALRERHRAEAVAAANADDGVAAIRRLLAELRTSHTSYFTPDDVAYYVLFDLFSGSAIEEAKARRFSGDEVTYPGIGAFTRRVEGQVYVKAVVDGGPAHVAGLRVGDRLIDVDGEPWEPIRHFRGKVGQRVPLRIQRTADESSIRELDVVPEEISPSSFYLEGMRESARVIATDRGGVGYVHIWSYAGQEYQDLLEQLVRSGELSNADALVIDLRDGWGGASPAYLRLFADKIPVMTMVRRDSTRSYDTQWRRPVALLIDDGTRSGKEVVAYGFRKHGYGPLVGTTTAGAVTAGRGIPVGERGLLYLAVAGVLVDGEELEGVGVEPTVEVPFPIPYADGLDPQLRAAVAALLDSPR